MHSHPYMQCAVTTHLHGDIMSHWSPPPPPPPNIPHPNSVCLTVNLNCREQLTLSPPSQPAPGSVDHQQSYHPCGRKEEKWEKECWHTTELGSSKRGGGFALKISNNFPFAFAFMQGSFMLSGVGVWRALKEAPICLQLWLELHNQLPTPAVSQMSQPKRQGNWLNVIVGRPLSNNRGC